MALVAIAIAAPVAIAVAAIATPAMPCGWFWTRLCAGFSTCNCRCSFAHISLANSGNPAEAIAAADTKPGGETIGIGEIGKYFRCRGAFGES